MLKVFIILMLQCFVGLSQSVVYRVRAVSKDSLVSISNHLIIPRKVPAPQPEIFIYDLTGRMVSKGGEATFLASGFYIVEFNGRKHKLIIK